MNPDPEEAQAKMDDQDLLVNLDLVVKLDLWDLQVLKVHVDLLAHQERVVSVVELDLQAVLDLMDSLDLQVLQAPGARVAPVDLQEAEVSLVLPGLQGLLDHEVLQVVLDPQENKVHVAHLMNEESEEP